MAKENIKRQVSNGQANGNRAMGTERAKTFRSFGKAPEGKVQQCLYETKWAAYQSWAVVERPDRQFAPMLTDEARRVLAEAGHADNNRA